MKLVKFVNASRTFDGDLICINPDFVMALQPTEDGDTKVIMAVSGDVKSFYVKCDIAYVAVALAYGGDPDA
jgi:hypothetical protein